MWENLVAIGRIERTLRLRVEKKEERKIGSKTYLRYTSMLVELSKQ